MQLRWTFELLILGLEWISISRWYSNIPFRSIYQKKSNSIQRKFHLDFFLYLIYQMCLQRFSLSLAGMVQKSSKFMTILNHFFQPSTRKNYPQLYILPAKRGISKCTAVSKQSLRSKVQLCHKYSTTRVSNYSPPYHTWKGIFMKSKSGISHFKS